MMNTQLQQGRELRDKALASLEAKRELWILEARDVAEKFALTYGTVTINDVRTAIKMPDEFHQNTWGAVLRGKKFEAIGYDQAQHPQAHARVVRIYKLREEQFNG